MNESSSWYFFETKESPPWISGKEIEEQRKFLPPLVFARLHGNIDTRGSGNFVTAEDLARCVDPNLEPQDRGLPGKIYSIGLDFGRVKDRAAVAVCHLDGSNVFLDDAKWWKGSHANPVSFAQVEEHLIGLSKRFEIGKAFCDPHQTQHLMERLQGTLPVEEFVFSQKSWNELATPFYQLLHYGRLKLYPDQIIEVELLTLELKQTSQGIRFDHSRGGYSDISTAIALSALAALKMGDYEEYPMTDLGVLEAVKLHEELDRIHGRIQVGKYTSKSSSKEGEEEEAIEEVKAFDNEISVWDRDLY